MFERIVSIDWSGANTEARGVSLRVAMHDAVTGESEIVERLHNGKAVRSWSRNACRQWLHDRLAEQRPTLFAMDFGFGYPWGTDQAVFGVEGWHAVVEDLRKRYQAADTARATAAAINALDRFGGHGPWRFDDTRSDFRFYVDHRVSYYRLTDLLAPQAISQWYLGSGGTVGFHSITGLAAIGWLIQERKRGAVDFDVWPHEVWEPKAGRHLLVESYPALCPALDDYGPCVDGHQRDAWRVLDYLRRQLAAGTLASLFQVPNIRCGRVEGVEFKAQVQFEGFILGLR